MLIQGESMDGRLGDAGGLLVSDTMYKDANPGGWRYNHGIGGRWSHEGPIGNNFVDDADLADGGLLEGVDDLIT